MSKETPKAATVNSSAHTVKDAAAKQAPAHAPHAPTQPAPGAPVANPNVQGQAFNPNAQPVTTAPIVEDNRPRTPDGQIDHDVRYRPEDFEAHRVGDSTAAHPETNKTKGATRSVTADSPVAHADNTDNVGPNAVAAATVKTANGNIENSNQFVLVRIKPDSKLDTHSALGFTFEKSDDWHKVPRVVGKELEQERHDGPHSEFVYEVREQDDPNVASPNAGPAGSLKNPRDPRATPSGAKAHDETTNPTHRR